jgi:hypothetical protein
MEAPGRNVSAGLILTALPAELCALTVVLRALPRGCSGRRVQRQGVSFGICCRKLALRGVYRRWRLGSPTIPAFANIGKERRVARYKNLAMDTFTMNTGSATGQVKMRCSLTLEIFCRLAANCHQWKQGAEDQASKHYRIPVERWPTPLYSYDSTPRAKVPIYALCLSRVPGRIGRANCRGLS